jgi:aquaporin Z
MPLLHSHLPAYLAEAALLALFMISACAVVALIEHPASPLRPRLPSPLLRRALVGVGMGLTAVALIFSPWGQRSGAHMNPAVTLAFLSRGLISPPDAAAYILAQFVGGAAGVLVFRALLPRVVAHPAVRFVVTEPGPRGPLIALAAEALISFVLFLTVLLSSNTPALAPYTPFFAGSLVALYITFEAPLSGMSMNPARTFGSALHARRFRHTWVYALAPVLAMLAAASVHAAAFPPPSACPKLARCSDPRCIFCDGRSIQARTLPTRSSP